MSKTTPVTVRAHFRYEDATLEWTATAAEHGNLQARGIDMRQARLRLEAALEQELKRPVEVESVLRLPKSLAQAVEAYTRDLDARDALTKKCEDGRLPLAKRLLTEGRLPQKEVAAMLRISGTWLGQQLREESTSRSMKIQEETPQRERTRKR